MNKLSPRLFEESKETGGGGGNNTPPAYDFRTDLPEELRKEPMLDLLKPKDMKDALGLLTKGYVSAQKMVGVDRLETPRKDWTPEKWAGFNKAIGVPEAADKYIDSDVKLPDGITIVPEKLKAAKEIFHKIGLRPEQAKAIMDFYTGDIAAQFGEQQTSSLTAKTAAQTKLTEMYGDKTAAKMDIARATVKKFGTPELVQAINESGFGNNPSFVKMIVDLGEAIMEDTAGGQGDGLPIGQVAKAQAEIAKLKGDREFQKQLNSKSTLGHKEALEKWTALHYAAYPNTPE